MPPPTPAPGALDAVAPPPSPPPWRMRASAVARRTVNPIRTLVDGLPLEPNPDKPVIALSIGDPTVFGNFGPPEEAVQAVQESVGSARFHGYAPSVGYREAREAVAEYESVRGLKVEYQDVVLCSGCSSALDLCLAALADPGQNVLVPRPGFPLYRTLAQSAGVSVRSYDLRGPPSSGCMLELHALAQPERGWEADLQQLERQADGDTAAIVVNNPSNPCGSVWPERHLRELLALAARLRLPVIADEIYEHLVFPGEEFVPLAALSSDVPILACGGLTKRFMCPGWRMGWIVVHDRGGAFGDEIRGALQSLSQRTIGSNTLVQGALPAILQLTPQSYFERTAAALQESAALVHGLLARVPGLRPVMPQGAMYMMVGVCLAEFPAFPCELAFVQRLMAEESVFCLPGGCFDFPGYVRLVLTPPEPLLREACERIAAFCERHRSPAAVATPADTAATGPLRLRALAREPAAATAGGCREP